MLSMTAQAFGVESFTDQAGQKRSLIRSSISSSSEFSIPPYEVVPATRPIIVLGPSLRGYEVTDLMHKALYNYLKKRFAGKINIYKTHADIGLSKRSSKSNPNEKERFNLVKSGGQRVTAEVQREVERIYELTKSLNLVVIDSEAINHPSQLTDCSLAPVVVYIKMPPDILQKLIKLRGRNRKNMGVQVVGTQKLTQCNDEMFDLILDEAIFEDACAHLGEFLDQYWRDLHPDDPEELRKMIINGADFPDRPNPLISSMSGRHKSAYDRRQSVAPPRAPDPERVLALQPATAARQSVSSNESGPANKNSIRRQRQGEKEVHGMARVSEARGLMPGNQYAGGEIPPEYQGYEDEAQYGYDQSYCAEQGYEQGFDYAAENPYGSPMALQDYSSTGQYDPNQYGAEIYEGQYQEGGDYQYNAELGYQQDYSPEYDSQQYGQEPQYGYQADSSGPLQGGLPYHAQGYGSYDERYPVADGGYY
ncbi:voltage-dependent L-type calcium channel subunit beta-1 isoform X2 [Nematostella vectensis]|uniref:voltage-dependent L-type calcium channel subunit beta-1 isoform X2 n=1 Tax=Nematostella vectensis TaxID=45351 RepID=UPI0013902326|nr:voltage-dependent L-type calcium channel subunit beta-1 isoform X2 [Nematostella vectensis]